MKEAPTPQFNNFRFLGPGDRLGKCLSPDGTHWIFDPLHSGFASEEVVPTRTDVRAHNARRTASQHIEDIACPVHARTRSIIRGPVTDEVGVVWDQEEIIFDHYAQLDAARQKREQAKRIDEDQSSLGEAA